MKKYSLAFILTLSALTTIAQYSLRTVDELINRTDSAANKVEVLPVDTLKAKDALYKTQVTTRSIMGAIVF